MILNTVHPCGGANKKPSNTAEWDLFGCQHPPFQLPPSRRDFIRTSLLAASAVLTKPIFARDASTHARGGITYPLTPADRELFTTVLTKLRGLLADAKEKSKVEYGNGLRLHTPDVSGKYRGIWPDDFLFPTIALPEKPDVAILNQTLAFLGDSMLNLDCVPDRVELDGLPIMKPGRSSRPPYGHEMPRHLPAAWVRLLDEYAKMGATIDRKDEWAALIERSFQRIPFANGMVYIDPQMPSVGFGFQDPNIITGLALFVSLILERGFIRAAELFQAELPQATIDGWHRRAAGIRANIHRLWDESSGAYFAGTRDCRQVDVWGNGLAYWMSDEAKQKRIIAWYQTHKDAIFRKGFTRQIAEKEGWQRIIGNTPVGNYTNGGFWLVGTGFVLPALAHGDIELARMLVRDLAANIEAQRLPEYINAGGEGAGASGFLMAMAMPAVAIECVLESKPWPGYF